MWLHRAMWLLTLHTKLSLSIRPQVIAGIPESLLPA
uniref:Uncharacterized protein n=1 Tax=Macrostomum lignano TaxID=282301 RepID=A0A1I8JEE8_9PLAT